MDSDDLAMVIKAMQDLHAVYDAERVRLMWLELHDEAVWWDRLINSHKQRDDRLSETWWSMRRQICHDLQGWARKWLRSDLALNSSCKWSMRQLAGGEYDIEYQVSNIAHNSHVRAGQPEYKQYEQNRAQARAEAAEQRERVLGGVNAG